MTTNARSQDAGDTSHALPLTRRSFLRGALFLGGSAVLAACGAPSTTTTSTTPGAAGAATAAPAQASGDVITITQWYHEYGEEGTQQAVQRYAEEYRQVNPKVKVNVVWNPGEYGTKLNAALLTDEGPDVFESQLSAAMVQAGQVVPLDDLYTEELRQDFGPGVMEQVSFGGQTYGVKMINDTAALYYRKSLLEAAGLQPPTTMDELIAAATQLTSGNVKGLYIGNDGVGQLPTIAPWSAGSELIQDNKIAFNNPRTVAAYEKVRELNASNALLIGAPTDWWDPSALIDGLAAMQWTGLWAMPAIQEALGDDFGVIPWPALDAQGKPATFLGGWTQMVNAKSKHIEESKAFVRWLWIENTAIQQDWSLAYGFHVPPRSSAATSAEPLKSGPAAEVVQILNNYGHPELPIWTGTMNTALTDALTNVVKNQADAQTEVAAAAQTAEAELAKVINA